MDLTPAPEKRAARAAKAVEAFLECGLSEHGQDPAVRGLAAVSTYAALQNLSREQLIGDKSTAELLLTVMHADLRVYAEHWQLDDAEIWDRTWAHTESFELFRPSVSSLQDSSRDIAYEVIPRLLADLLLCGARLGLDVQELAHDGHGEYLAIYGE